MIFILKKRRKGKMKVDIAIGAQLWRLHLVRDEIKQCLLPELPNVCLRVPVGTEPTGFNTGFEASYCCGHNTKFYDVELSALDRIANKNSFSNYHSPGIVRGA